MALGLLVLGDVNAASTYVRNGIDYVKLDEFSKENNISISNNMGEIILTRGSVKVYIADNPKQSTVNGIVTEFSGPAINILGDIAIPLLDVQKAFGLKISPAKTSDTPTIITPSTPMQPTAPPSAVNIAVAPNGYFKYGGKEMPVKAEAYRGVTILSINEPQKSLSIFNPKSIDSRYRLAGTSLIPSTLIDSCLNQVREGLKSPASAQFVSGTMSIYTNKNWAVLGVFDAQNSYGGFLRGDYACFMRTNGDVLETVLSITTRR